MKIDPWPYIEAVTKLAAMVTALSPLLSPLFKTAWQKLIKWVWEKLKQAWQKLKNKNNC